MVLNGLLAMSELAVVSSRRGRLKALADNGTRGARAAMKLTEDPGEFLATVQIGITLVGILAGAFGGSALAAPIGRWLETFPGVAPNGESIAFAIVVVGITYLSLVIGELVPKRIALRYPERVAAAVAGPMRILSRIAAPAVWLLKVSTNALLSILGLMGARENTVSEDEVRSLIAEGTRAGVFEPEEKAMIDGVLRLADRTVRAIMTPRPEIAWIDADASPGEVLERIGSIEHARFPVCRGDLDELIGVVDTKDLLERALSGRPVDLTVSARMPVVVHDNLPVLRLLDVLRDAHSHMALVVDEFGSVEGLVTLTDVLETIAGDFPQSAEDAEPAIVERADGSLLVDGRLPLDELQDRLGIGGLAADGSFHTVAGLVLYRLGRIPQIGDGVDVASCHIEVVDMDGRRVDRVLVTRTAPPDPEASDEGGAGPA